MSNGLLSKPLLGENPITLRPYQEEAVEAVRDAFRNKHKSALIVCATGTGKSRIAGQITRYAIEKGNRVLILCPTRHLVQQMANTLDEMGVEPGVEMGNIRARELFDADAVVATLATMHPRRLAMEWPQDYFQLTICDEAHHYVTKNARRVLSHFTGARILGMTATADRNDGQELGSVFGHLAYEFNLWQAMTAPEPGPYLSRLTYVQCDVEIDLRDLGKKTADFTDADLEARIAPLIDVLANAIRQESEDRSTLIFTPLIGSAQAMATALQSLGCQAEWVSGDDPDRESKIARYQEGKLQYLATVQLLCEGVDLPRTSALALCRATKSRPFYAQCIGRGTRLFPGKSDCRIIDFGFLTTTHDLVVPVELCDGSNVDGEVLEIAQGLMKKDKRIDLVEAVEEAEKEHKRRQVIRVKAHDRKIKYRRVSYDPLSMSDAIGMPWRGSRVKDSVVDRATPRQVELLNGFGVQDAANLSRTRSRTMLDYLFSRRKAGLATPKQVSHLIANNVPPEVARAMKFGEASAKLSSIWGK